MKPLISLIHASYGRPEKALMAFRMWQDHAVNPQRLDYILALNTEDHGRYREVFGSAFPRCCTGLFAGSAQAWNSAAPMADGKLLIQVSDDLEPPQQWDITLSGRLQLEVGPDWMNQPVFVAVSDGYRKDELCTAAMMTRAYIEQKDHFIPPQYISMFSDDEVTYRAKRDARDGKVKFVDARDLVFRHRHHCHDKNVPYDATYARTNHEDNYRDGREMFFARNPEAETDGLRTWK